MPSPGDWASGVHRSLSTSPAGSVGVIWLRLSGRRRPSTSVATRFAPPCVGSRSTSSGTPGRRRARWPRFLLPGGCALARATRLTWRWSFGRRSAVHWLSPTPPGLPTLLVSIVIRMSTRRARTPSTLSGSAALRSPAWAVGWVGRWCGGGVLRVPSALCRRVCARRLRAVRLRRARFRLRLRFRGRWGLCRVGDFWAGRCGGLALGVRWAAPRRLASVVPLAAPSPWLPVLAARGRVAGRRCPWGVGAGGLCAPPSVPLRLLCVRLARAVRRARLLWSLPPRPWRGVVRLSAGLCPRMLLSLCVRLRPPGPWRCGAPRLSPLWRCRLLPPRLARGV
jgi:hypothetical protein